MLGSIVLQSGEVGTVGHDDVTRRNAPGMDLKRREGPATFRSASNCKREMGRSEGPGRRTYSYEITENSFTYMATWAERRNANRTLEIVEPRVGGLLLQDNRPAHAEDR
jgi:hypothetical protein